MRGWRRKKNKEVINCDLWKTLDVLSRKHKIEFIWVKGHANVPLNERCDQLAENALNSSNLLIDEGYEKLSEKTIDSQYGLF
jgi:ribonuclease HI